MSTITAVWERAPREPLGHRLSVLAGLIIPSLGAPGLALLLTSYDLSLKQHLLLAGCMIASYLYSGFGITVGYHRLETHKAFQVPLWLRQQFIIAGSSALQGPVSRWVPDHRKHHKFSDKPGDPHSPHGHGEGWGSMWAGLWHAHTGWLSRKSDAPVALYAKEYVDDPFVAAVSRLQWYLLIVIARLVIVPALLGLVVVGGPIGALYGIVWIGLVPAILLLEFTFSINSVCHYFGRQPFETGDESRDVWWLRLWTMGESNHNGHHAFPRSFRHGLAGGLDPSALLILALERIGLAHDLVRVGPESLAKKKKKLRTAC